MKTILHKGGLSGLEARAYLYKNRHLAPLPITSCPDGDEKIKCSFGVEWLILTTNFRINWTLCWRLCSPNPHLLALPSGSVELDQFIIRAALDQRICHEEISENWPQHLRQLLRLMADQGLITEKNYLSSQEQNMPLTCPFESRLWVVRN